MPALHYWVSGAALWLAGSFAITVILAIVGIKEMISNKMAVLLIGAALLIMFIGWWTTAEQEEASVQREIKIDRLQETLDVIKSAIPVLDNTSTVQNLSQLSNAQLRQRVSDLTARMRTFEGVIKAEETKELFEKRQTSILEQPPQNNRNVETARMLERSTEVQTQFRSQLLPQALALREILSNRIGISQPYPLIPNNVALDYGILAGPSPISNAANYLEQLARQLPP
jgi:hypothetical protein